MTTVRVLIGPMVASAWAIAVGWLAMAVVILASGRSPLAIGLGVAAVLLGAGTAWVGAAMVVRVTADGVVIGGRLVGWAEVDGIAIRPGGRLITVHVPVLARRQGRALIEVEMDGLSSLRSARAVARAVAPIAERAGVEVTVLEKPGKARSGRRVHA